MLDDLFNLKENEEFIKCFDEFENFKNKNENLEFVKELRILDSFVFLFLKKEERRKILKKNLKKQNHN